MAAYQQLPQAGKTNVGTISKHLKEFSFRVKSIRSATESGFGSLVQDLESFHSGLKEIIYHSTVPGVQNAKLFAIKNQYNNITPCYESIVSLNQLILSQQGNGEDFSGNLEKLNEKYEDHENIHKDICALYELFKEFEFEEIRVQQEEEKNKNKDKENINERAKENEGDPQVLNKIDQKSKTWLWVLLISLLLLLSILGIYLI